MSDKERIHRLERVVLALAAIMTGEAQEVGSPEEVEVMQAQLGADMTSMASDQ
jgi:hypothetical protein